MKEFRKYYRCNKCGETIAKSGSKPLMCTSNKLLPVRQICGGIFSVEISLDDVIKQFKDWNYTDEQINDYINKD
jgi:hypothetical protein